MQFFVTSRNKKKNHKALGTGARTQIEHGIAFGTDKNVRTETSCVLTNFNLNLFLTSLYRKGTKNLKR